MTRKVFGSFWLILVFFFCLFKVACFPLQRASFVPFCLLSITRCPHGNGRELKKKIFLKNFSSTFYFWRTWRHKINTKRGSNYRGSVLLNYIEKQTRLRCCRWEELGFLGALTWNELPFELDWTCFSAGVLMQYFRFQQGWVFFCHRTA